MKKITISLMILLVISLVALGLPACSQQPAPAPAPAPTVTVTAQPTAAPAPKPTTPVVTGRVTILTAPVTTSGHIISMGVETISKDKKSPIEFVTSGTAGATFNTMFVNEHPDIWEKTIFCATAPVFYIAAQGMAPFKEKQVGFSYVANYNFQSVWLATLDPNIKTLADLKGKKIALGNPGQITWNWDYQYLIGLAGLKDDINVQATGSDSDAVNALLDGLVSAASVGVYMNPVTLEMVTAPGTQQLLASGKTIYSIPWPKALVENARTKTNGEFAAYTIPAGKVDWIKDGLETMLVQNAWGVKDVLREEYGYAFVKLLLDNYKEFPKFHALGKLITPEGLGYTVNKSNWHPGAIRAYAEYGLKIADK